MSDSCVEVAAELGVEAMDGFYPPGCCDSCHEDVDLGYPLPELKDRREVCCHWLRLAEDAGL